MIHYPKFIVSDQKEESISIQRVNSSTWTCCTIILAIIVKLEPPPSPIFCSKAKLLVLKLIKKIQKNHCCSILVTDRQTVTEENIGEIKI